MPSEANFLDISLLGKEYRVACSPEDREALLRAVAFLDGRMQDIAKKVHSNATERIAVMAALNVTHEFLSSQQGTPVVSVQSQDVALDFAAVKCRIALMEAQIDTVLDHQNTLLV